jgi:xanthine dehydrogenase accessory factor
VLKELRVLIKGGGEVASAIAHKLQRSGFKVCLTEIPRPLAVSRGTSFCEAAYDGVTEVEGVRARRIDSHQEIVPTWERGEIPLLIDPQAGVKEYLKPDIVIDAIMAKRNTGTAINDAPLVIGLGPGFHAGRDVHAVIETNNSENLGKVILQGEAEPNTGIPLEVGLLTRERAMFSPVEGVFHATRQIGDMVGTGDTVGSVEGESVKAQTDGILRALLRDGLHISKGTKLGEVDPRREKWLCYAIRPRMRTIAGGVLEAILMHLNTQL